MTFEEAMDISKRIDRMADDLRSKLCETLSKLPIKGKYLNDGKNGGPIIAIVKYSELRDNWSPEYHLPPAQARAICKYISKYQTADGICSAVRDMLDNGYVIVEGDKTFLNERTMDAIRESEIGQYVINHAPEMVVINVTDIQWLNKGVFDRTPKTVKLKFPRKLLQDEGCMDSQGSMLERMYDKIVNELERRYNNTSFQFGYDTLRTKRA